MDRKLIKFLQLPFGDKLLLLEAWVMLGLARACVLSFPFTRALRLFKGSAGAHRGSVGDRADAPARVSRAIGVAARFTPWDSNCLAQALAGSGMLRIRGVPCQLYLGVARPGDSVAAHAWLTCGDVFVSGEAGHEGYSVVSVF